MINHKLLSESCCNDKSKYIEGVGNDHLIKNICENMELSKYTQYRILGPHNNGNVKLTGVDGEQATPQKIQIQMQE